MRACRSLSDEQMDSSFRWNDDQDAVRRDGLDPGLRRDDGFPPGTTDSKPGFGMGLDSRLSPVTMIGS